MAPCHDNIRPSPAGLPPVYTPTPQVHLNGCIQCIARVLEHWVGSVSGSYCVFGSDMGRLKNTGSAWSEFHIEYRF